MSLASVTLESLIRYFLFSVPYSLLFHCLPKRKTMPVLKPRVYWTVEPKPVK